LGFAEAGLLHDVAEGFAADAAFADVLVGGPRGSRGAVFESLRWEGGEAVAADELIEACEGFFDAGGGGDVVAAGEEMGGIQADAEALGALDVIQDVREFFERPAKGGSLPGGDFEGDADGFLGDFGEKGRRDWRRLGQASLSAGSQWAPGWRTRKGRPSCSARDQLLPEAAHRAGVEIGVGGGEIDQISGVAEHGAQFSAPGVIAECGGLGVREGRGEPCILFFTKICMAVQPMARARSMAMAQSAGGGDVGAEEGGDC